MPKFSIFLLLIHLSIFAAGQIGGDNTYEFLNLNTSARIASLGGNQIAVKDDDPFLGFVNPSLLNEEMDNKLALTYVSYLADINVGFASYTKSIDSLGTFNIGVQYVDYGSFTETDLGGNEIGNFTAGEYAFVLGYSYPIDTNFSVGANLKTIYSSFYDYQSVGLAADIGASYYSKKSGVTMSLLAKNMGTQITSYSEADAEDLPFELQFGITKRFKNVPLRLGVIAQHLQQWDLTYENPNDQDGQGLLGDDTENDSNENGFLDKLARHFIFNAEMLISKNFNIRFGYNYLRRAELKVDEKTGTVGMSLGVGFRISKFHISYGRAAYHQVGPTNTFSVSTRLSDFIN